MAHPQPLLTAAAIAAPNLPSSIPSILMGFVAGGLAHSLSNPFTEDLVYLMGGLRLEFDICDYPRVNKRLYRRGEQREYVDLGE